MLPERRLAATRARPRAMACKVNNPLHGRASAPLSRGAHAAKNNGLIFEHGKRALFRARRLRYAWFNQAAASALIFLYCFARELALQRCEETHWISIVIDRSAFVVIAAPIQTRQRYCKACVKNKRRRSKSFNESAREARYKYGGAALRHEAERGI